jgi:transcriptional regulator with XRE-family HTH domain
MWADVGKVLQRARMERQWRLMDVERAGGPSYKTVQAIEQGEVGTVESLEKCAQALDLSIVDILQSVLDSRVTPLTPEAAHVVRKFVETTVAGRSAMLAVANALPVADATTGTPPIPAAAAGPAAAGRPRPVRPAAKRRSAR